jgi:bifunctional UDP-N-acetylglucosamine pyrophosphorylase/glucosamine-1-phosphate N-acetyltransferase
MEHRFMTRDTSDVALLERLRSLSSPFTDRERPVAVVLAAGQGKRIKSSRSKMLHKIWGEPTVGRVVRAAEEGLESPNQIVVVGIKARDVAETLGTKLGRLFACQTEQKGTGHAVQVALAAVGAEETDRDFYIFPGDMGLIDTPTVRSFREAFASSGAHMMLMVGTYAGPPEDNYYGRILRVPETDATGAPSLDATGRIIRILEYKDILALKKDEPYTVDFLGRRYAWSRERLLALSEYNSGFYAFQGQHLTALLPQLGYENVQGEMYLTDLVSLFNEAGLVVAGAPPLREEVLLGFNDKAVLRQMNGIARAAVWEKLNKLIAIADKDDFFIADDVVEHLLDLDRSGAAHDIAVGKGAFLGAGVRLAEGVHIARQARLEGNVLLSRNVSIGEAAHLSAFPHQTLRVGEGTSILKDDVLKGNITIGADCRIEAPVRLTGSVAHPLGLGARVRIKGDTYLYGSRVEADCVIVHCVLRQVRVACRRDVAGAVVPVCYVFPAPSGRESISPL